MGRLAFLIWKPLLNVKTISNNCANSSPIGTFASHCRNSICELVSILFFLFSQLQPFTGNSRPRLYEWSFRGKHVRLWKPISAITDTVNLLHSGAQGSHVEEIKYIIQMVCYRNFEDFAFSDDEDCHSLKGLRIDTLIKIYFRMIIIGKLFKIVFKGISWPSSHLICRILMPSYPVTSPHFPLFNLKRTKLIGIWYYFDAS